MQRIANYGSFLQAYGLKKILEELNCEVEFVDYHPGQTLIPADGGTGLARIISKVISVFKYSAPMKEKLRFIKYKRGYAKNYFPYLGISEKKNYAPELDLLIIGSDEVFNCVQNNTNVGFSPELFGEGNNAKALISYAASFGNTTIDKLEQYNVREKVAEWLNRFDAISVRDVNSGAIIEKLIGSEPEYNLDPVLAYDFLGMCKDIPESVSESGYMLLYGYSGRFTKEECRLIRKYARKNGLKVLCIGGIQACCDKFIDCNPFQVIAYFQHADCVVTDTFHGTIMSIITHQKFVTFVRDTGYGNSEKITDLLNRLKLSDRIITNIQMLDEMLLRTIEYTEADNVIMKERAHTRQYLKKHIRADI